VELVDHLPHRDEPERALKNSREGRVAIGYYLYGIIVGGFFFALGVVGLQAADSFGEWLWEGAVPGALQPILMLLAGRMLRVRPTLGRHIAFAMAIITLVCLVLVSMPLHHPKSDIGRAFRTFIFTQSLNSPGAAILAFLLAWPDLRNAIPHTRQPR
jgi:hypothetical protein